MTGRAALAACALALGCVDAETIDEHPCPTEGTALTFENFGKPFFDRWCMSCHEDSPGGITFMTRAQVFEHRDRIFINAAAGNTFMPPGPDDPPEDERDMLAEWLACGAP